MSLLENQQKAENVDIIYIDLETRLMQNIARHLQAWKQPIDSDRWLLKMLAQIGQLNKENIKIIAQMSGMSQTTAERMLNAAAEEVIEDLEPGFEELAKKGYIDAAVAVPKSKNVSQAMDNMVSQAKDKLNLTNTTMLHSAQKAFRNLVSTIAKESIEIMNKSATSVITGAEARQQVLEKAIRQFNEKGITGFVDKAGREWTPEAYVNMVIRTTAGNVATEVQTARERDYGIELIEISSHTGARPKCAKDQGKIFSLDNKRGQTEDLNGRKVEYYPWNSSSYGEPDGILGINCTHHKFSFIPGISIQRYFPTKDFEENKRLYKQTQIQRALERDVRKQKRECMLYKEIGDQEAFEKASVKLKSKEAALVDYVDRNKFLHRRRDREKVVGFDKHTSAEAVGKAKTHYRDWAKSIGAETGPETLAGYYKLKYNEDKESRLYKGYIAAVNKGRISPLVGYDKFQEVASNIESQFVGTKTADGMEIKGYTAHFVDRVIGQRSEDSPDKKGTRKGVGFADIEDALKNPKKIGPVVEQDNGNRSKLYFGKNAAVSYNPDTGELIQVQPKRTK